MAHTQEIKIDGYVPYATGGIAIKDKRALGLISYYAAYVFDNKGGLSTNFGSVILEGSKAGAAAAAAWAAHRLIPLNVTGYGQIAGRSIEAENQDRAYEDVAGPVRKYYMHLMPAQNMERLNIGHTVGYRHNSCSSLASGTTQWTRDYSPCITGHRSNRDRGQASSRAKDILIRIQAGLRSGFYDSIFACCKHRSGA